ncbi:MAG TPA: hypothetical protein VKA84_03345 [Gemmatimonadaceae bacterium]|nr:hypothetical protein [Gemmatimonadaceae bacterium]
MVRRQEPGTGFGARRVSPLALAAWLAACGAGCGRRAPPADGGPPPATGAAASAAEAAVYAAVAEHYPYVFGPSADSAFVVVDTPVKLLLYPEPGRGVPDLAWLPRKLRGLEPATLADFRANVGGATPVWWRDSVAARLGPRLRWLSGEPPIAPLPEYPTLIPPRIRTRVGLARVGFAPGRRQALVYVEWLCGGMCGSGQYVLLGRRGGGAWAVRRIFEVWAS